MTELKEIDSFKELSYTGNSLTQTILFNMLLGGIAGALILIALN